MTDLYKNFKKACFKPIWRYFRRSKRLEKRTKALKDICHLQPLDIKKESINSAKRLLICCVGPGTGDLSDFLCHYRGIGVQHMLFIDCGTSENVSRLLMEQEDCSIWKTSLGFKESGYGCQFYNTLLHHFCLDKWTLCVDAEEFFVFPYMETRSLQDLIGQLEDCNRTTLWAFSVHLYGSAPLLESEPGKKDLCYFDPSGYYQSYGQNGQIEAWGGSCGRLLDRKQKLTSSSLDKIPSDEILGSHTEDSKELVPLVETLRAPTLHKIPLVKPNKFFFYNFRQREVMDKNKNWPHKWHPCPTGVLLTYKYHKEFCERLVQKCEFTSLIPGSDVLDSILVDLVEQNPGFSLIEPWSVPYESSMSLIEHGLLSDGCALRPSAYMVSVR